MSDLDYKEINELTEALALSDNNEFAIDQSGIMKKVKYSVLKQQVIDNVKADLPDEDIDFTGDNTHAGTEDFDGEVNLNDDVNYNSESLCQWYKVPNPTAGYAFQKTSGWTADRFTAASGGMELDFSAIVPAGTKMVRVDIHHTTPQSDLYSRPAGDDTFCSNTPIANTEYFARISNLASGDVDGGVRVDLWLNDSLVAEIAVENTGDDVYVSYPGFIYGPTKPT